MTDTMTSQNIVPSSWDTLYIDTHTHILDKIEALVGQNKYKIGQQ
jgi:hypothetical protein